ncbi:MAG: hypothetical protein JXR63_11810 [Spirochaetales bacterium]|nr:hypothetical protein [Spirochaetales bacterium]
MKKYIYHLLVLFLLAACVEPLFEAEELVFLSEGGEAVGSKFIGKSLDGVYHYLVDEESFGTLGESFISGGALVRGLGGVSRDSSIGLFRDGCFVLGKLSFSIRVYPLIEGSEYFSGADASLNYLVGGESFVAWSSRIAYGGGGSGSSNYLNVLTPLMVVDGCEPARVSLPHSQLRSGGGLVVDGDFIFVGAPASGSVGSGEIYVYFFNEELRRLESVDCLVSPNLNSSFGLSLFVDGGTSLYVAEANSDRTTTLLRYSLGEEIVFEDSFSYGASIKDKNPAMCGEALFFSSSYEGDSGLLRFDLDSQEFVFYPFDSLGLPSSSSPSYISSSADRLVFPSSCMEDSVFLVDCSVAELSLLRYSLPGFRFFFGGEPTFSYLSDYGEWVFLVYSEDWSYLKTVCSGFTDEHFEEMAYFQRFRDDAYITQLASTEDYLVGGFWRGEDEGSELGVVFSLLKPAP